MFAEAVHSLVDVANQTLLRVGILKARRAPTEAHPLGFARDAFIWPLISAVGIFCLGAGVSFVHGVAGFFEPAREIGDLTASYAVLAVSFALESHSLVVALRTLQSRAARHGMGLLAYLKTGADPAATAVMMEDGAAVAGLLIAGGCLGLCQLTGSALWDSAGSVAVSVLLGAVAASLIQRNRLFLIGKAMPNDQERRVIGYLESDPVIRRVRNARSEELGVRAYRFYGEIAFDGGEMARRCLDRVGRRRLFGALAAAAAARDAGRMDALMTAYSAAVVSATGAEVDRLERQISALVPGIKHVDLETDREAAGPRSGSRRRRREQMAAAAVAAAAGVGARGAVGAGAGAGAGAAGDGAESGQDDEVYGGAQLLFGDALDWDGGGSSGSSTKAAIPVRDADADAEAAAAAAWLEKQLPPDGSTAARRARPSLSAEAYREQELQAERASEQFLMEKQREERML
jgi:zinc transporter 9